MRRASTVVAVLALGLLALPALASATPTVKFKAEAVPIPGFPGTGELPRRGCCRARRIPDRRRPNTAGSRPRSWASTSTCRRVPSCTRTGFPTCAKSVLEQTGPSGCKNPPKPARSATCWGSCPSAANVSKRPPTLQSFYSPEGGLEFFTNGHSPVSLEILSAGHYVNLGGGGGYGPELIDPGAARLDGAGCPLRVGQVDQREGRLGLQEGQGNGSTTAASRRSARRAASRSRPK